MTKPDRNRLVLFFSVLAVAAVLLIVVAELADMNPITLAPIYMFSPMIAGLIVSWRYGISISELGLQLGRPRWLVISAVIALPLIGLTLLLAIGVPGVGFDPTVDLLPGIELPPGMLGVAAAFGLVLGIGVTINAFFAFGEEFGWRGYLLWELAPWGFWKASFVIGAIWGLWHAPVIIAGYNYPSFPFVGVLFMMLACAVFSPIYTYLVVRARSVLAAALLHGVFNGSAGIVVAFAVTDTVFLGELVASPVGLAGILAFGVVTVGIAASGAPPLTREFARDGGDVAAAHTPAPSGD